MSWFTRMRKSWEEDQHPRDEHGKFTDGAGDGGASNKGTLHERAARALGWTPKDAQSMSLSSLRENVRPVSRELADEISGVLQSGRSIMEADRKPSADMSWLGKPPPPLTGAAREAIHAQYKGIPTGLTPEEEAQRKAKQEAWERSQGYPTEQEIQAAEDADMPRRKRKP